MPVGASTVAEPTETTVEPSTVTSAPALIALDGTKRRTAVPSSGGTSESRAPSKADSSSAGRVQEPPDFEMAPATFQEVPVA